MSMTIGSATSGLSTASAENQVGLAMLKKGMDASASTAMQLLQQMPPAPQPAHLGQSVNMLA